MPIILGTRRNTPWLVALSGAIALAFAVAACGGEGQSTLEERGQSIDRALICPVCPSETIDQAQVELAHQMRALVREKLADGWSREQILQFFVDRYGEGVLAAPPKSGFSLLAWIIPPVAVAGSVALLVFTLRSMRRDVEVTPEARRPEEEELEPYLVVVDQEVGLSPHGSKVREKGG